VTRTYNLTDGSILKALFKIALPIMGTSFVQMAYNMTDMFWVGKLGSGAVASVGTAGFFTWLAAAFILIPKIGAEVGVAQAVGRENISEARVYIKHSIQMAVYLGLGYGLILILFRHPLIGFFNLEDTGIIEDAVTYLMIVSVGLVFYFVAPVFTAMFNGYGDSRTPFLINTTGLVVNMILDPVLIFGIGPFPRLGVLGAALATVIAQAVVIVVFVAVTPRRPELFSDLKLLSAPSAGYVARIVRLGLPAGLQSGLFTIFAMIIARIIAKWGPVPIAVQKVGSQIEAISWMTAGGFQTAMSTFVGQNYGANKWKRVANGYFVGMAIMSIVGIVASALLILAARPLFSIFIQEDEAIREGIVYLRILGLSQLFMCLESTSAGAFNGLGKTVPPSVVGIVFNALRIPASLMLSSTALGLHGVWWAISVSSIFKGTVLSAWYMATLTKNAEITPVMMYIRNKCSANVEKNA